MSDDLDPKLKAIYDDMPKDEPSPEVDRRILRAAGRFAVRPGWRDWLVPFGAVAGVVAVSTLVVHWQSREPEIMREAVNVRQSAPVASSPGSQPPMQAGQETLTSAPLEEWAAMMAEDPLADERARAEQRAAELSRLRQEMARRSDAEGVAVPPADLPTLKLKPEAPLKKDEAVATAPSAAPSTLSGRVSEQLRAPAPGGEADSLRAPALAAPRVAIASILLEGVSLGMHREDLAALGWGCAQSVCTRQIDDPRQPAYWNLPVMGATQRALFVDEAVTAMTLSQVNVAINNVKLSLERIGKPSERTCPLGGGDQLVSRQAGGMILTLWQNGELTTLGVCQAR